MGLSIMSAEKIITKAGRYLQEVLGCEAIGGGWAIPWSGAGQLPFFLQNSYNYYQAELCGHPSLLMLSQTPGGETPAVVRKHWQAVSKHFQGNVIYLVEAVSSYNRKRLIEQRVPFLVPGNQLYLPPLGMDLREYFKSGRQEEKPHLSAAAQAVVLREILQHDCSGRSAKELAQRLGYSPMTLTRAFRDLAERQLAVVEQVGREKHLQFQSSGRSLWEAARPSLQSPVKKRVWIAWRSRGILQYTAEMRVAGETALAHYTMLADSGINQWALSAGDWPGLIKRADIQVLEGKSSGEYSPARYDRDLAEIELWAYSPEVVGKDQQWVDPLSLWLSFETHPDERIDMARESLLEDLWR